MNRALVVGALLSLASGVQAPPPLPPVPTLVDIPTIRVGELKAGGGYSVSVMPLDTYVARVLAGEAVRDSRPAALEALAIAVRTFALANRTRHRADGFDVCDQTHCQVLRTATAATDRAARATSGRILVRQGAPAAIYYTASCGGRTEIPSHVWPGAEDPAFLPSQLDDACEGEPAWSADLDARDLARALRASGFTGDRVRELKVASHNTSGRVATLKIDGFRPDQISGQDLRVAVGRTLGWQRIKSTAFELTRRGDVYHFAGHGYGHGVGMCVIGSAKLAERGVTADAILARYFPGLDVTRSLAAAGSAAAGSDPRPAAPGSSRGLTPSRGRGLTPNGTTVVPPPAVVVSLPDEDEGERAVIVRQTLRARDELARALGVAAPASVTLRFHPTTDEYERATSKPWFTSAALVGGQLHLLPLATLRQRGILESTVRRELVHVMADAALAARPAWVREGAAAYYASGAPATPPAQRPAFRPELRPSCPSDAELLQPVSAGALANAYTRARQCFGAQIASGKSWRDVR
jgi:stage II sporulation protein D (peptidoglycan lytic transglycosylase)